VAARPGLSLPRPALRAGGAHFIQLFSDHIEKPKKLLK